ncbi:MAG: YybH family protein [Solirubrobacteraceae bacterium]
MDPYGVVQELGDRLSAGDVDGAVALYEENATFAVRPDEVVRGGEAIRAALAQFAALEPRMEGQKVKVLEAGDTALVVNRWTLRGTTPDGQPLEMAGTSADVLRRQADGRWLVAIDDPWGGGAN